MHTFNFCAELVTFHLWLVVCFWYFVFYNFLCSTDSPRDSVQFIEWSPTSCPRALLIANFHGRITIWTQTSQVSWFLDYSAFCRPLHFLSACIFGDLQVLGVRFLTFSMSHLVANTWLSLGFARMLHVPDYFCIVASKKYSYLTCMLGYSGSS